MTSGERDLLVMALDILVIADEQADPAPAAQKIAAKLAAWRRETTERAGRACLYVAHEWRDGASDIYGKSTIGEEGQALRERSAEAAELCAYRVAPWLRPGEKESTDR